MGKKGSHNKQEILRRTGKPGNPKKQGKEGQLGRLLEVKSDTCSIRGYALEHGTEELQGDREVTILDAPIFTSNFKSNSLAISNRSSDLNRWDFRCDLDRSEKPRIRSSCTIGLPPRVPCRLFPGGPSTLGIWKKNKDGLGASWRALAKPPSVGAIFPKDSLSLYVPFLVI